MAITSGFYNSVNGDRTYDADQFGSLFDGIIAPGVFPNVGDKFRVRPTNNGMSVYVGSGKAWLNNRWVENSGDETVTLTGSHATLDRIDLVCVEVDRSKAIRGAKIKVVQGTPAVTPTVPSVDDNGDRRTFALAQIKIIKNSLQIAAENIISLVGSARTPYVSGPLQNINLDALQAKLQGEFNTWFESVRDALANAGGNTSTDVANLKVSDRNQNERLQAVEGRIAGTELNITKINEKFSNSGSVYGMLNDSNVGVHNSIYRGASLGSNVTPYLQAIRSGSFSGLYLGDYWTYSGITWRIVAFNYFINIGEPPFRQNHIVVVPDASLFRDAWSTTIPDQRSYVDSTLNQSTMTKASRMAESLFNRSNMVGVWTRVATGYDGNGAVKEWRWYNPHINIMDEAMLWGSSIFDDSLSRGIHHNQFPAFRLNPALVNIEEEYWLRERASAQTAVYMKSTGQFSHAPLNYSFGVRPYLAIG